MNYSAQNTASKLWVTRSNRVGITWPPFLAAFL